MPPAVNDRAKIGIAAERGVAVMLFAVLGKCVPLVRSCVLAYVRTAFLGTQERRNAKFFKGTQVRGTHHPKF